MKVLSSLEDVRVDCNSVTNELRGRPVGVVWVRKEELVYCQTNRWPPQSRWASLVYIPGYRGRGAQAAPKGIPPYAITNWEYSYQPTLCTYIKQSSQRTELLLVPNGETELLKLDLP